MEYISKKVAAYGQFVLVKLLPRKFAKRFIRERVLFCKKVADCEYVSEYSLNSTGHFSSEKTL